MKYYLPLLTALVLCAGLCGCTPSEEPISAPEEPVSQPEVVLRCRTRYRWRRPRTFTNRC